MQMCAVNKIGSTSRTSKKNDKQSANVTLSIITRNEKLN